MKALRAVRRARRLDSFLEAFWMLGAPQTYFFSEKKCFKKCFKKRLLSCHFIKLFRCRTFSEQKTATRVHFGSIPAFRDTFEVTFCTFWLLWVDFWSNLQLLGALWGHFGLICSVKKRTGAPKVLQERPKAPTTEIPSPIWTPWGGMLSHICIFWGQKMWT